MATAIASPSLTQRRRTSFDFIGCGCFIESGAPQLASFGYRNHIHRGCARQTDGFDFGLRGGGRAQWVEEFGPDVVELLAGFIRRYVIGSFDEVLEVAAGLLENVAQGMEAFPTFACSVGRVHDVS